MSQGIPEFKPGPTNYDPYQSGFGDPPPKKSKSLLGIIVIGLVVVLFCCGGPIGGTVWLVGFGLGVIEEELVAQLRDHPTVREHLGEIQSFETDFTASVAHDDEDTFIYDVQGTKGSGRFTIKHVTGNDGSEEIVFAELRLPDGRTVAVVPQQ